MKTSIRIFHYLLFSTFFVLASCDLDGEENFSWRPGNTLAIDGSGAVSLSEGQGQDEVYFVEGHDRAKTYTWTVNGNPVNAIREGEMILYTFTAPGTYEIKVSNGSHEGTKTVTVTE